MQELPPACRPRSPNQGLLANFLAPPLAHRLWVPDGELSGSGHRWCWGPNRAAGHPRSALITGQALEPYLCTNFMCWASSRNTNKNGDNFVYKIDKKNFKDSSQWGKQRATSLTSRERGIGITFPVSKGATRFWKCSYSFICSFHFQEFIWK